MLVGIEIWQARMIAFKVQTIWRDDAEQILQRRERD